MVGAFGCNLQSNALILSIRLLSFSLERILYSLVRFLCRSILLPFKHTHTKIILLLALSLNSLTLSFLFNRRYSLLLLFFIIQLPTPFDYSCVVNVISMIIILLYVCISYYLYSFAVVPSSSSVSIRHNFFTI